MAVDSGANKIHRFCQGCTFAEILLMPGEQAIVNEIMQRAAAASGPYGRLSLKARAGFLTAVAEALEMRKDDLIATAARETHLEPARLLTELQRTQWQLHSYGQACADGAWLDIRIDTPHAPSKTDRQNKYPWQAHSRQNDLRKMLVPLGPVVVFGASNFPFAYSTAGGDTACALAAGCVVIVKAHPAHAETSRMVAAAVQDAAVRAGLPEGVFQHVEGGFETGAALVQHPLTSAVGFTGSLEGGRALFDLANARPVPITVFAEMGSVNPVFLLPGRVSKDPTGLATMLAASISASAGQFCTNPGLMIGIENEGLEQFCKEVALQISMVPPVEMLHPGIAKAFQHKRADALAVDGVRVEGTLSCPVGAKESIPTIASVAADVFLKNDLLQQEVFGPFSLLVRCRDAAEMLAVAESLNGQLTTTIFGESNELPEHANLIEILRRRCGRLLRNGVPTGVEVVPAMMHGGPYPASTDSRFSAVGADGIRRFARPVCYQNWEDEALPEELQAANPLGLWRTVNGRLSTETF